MRYFLFSTILATAVATGCVKHKTPEPAAIQIVDTVSFSQKILPMIQTNCSTSGCHDAGSGADGYILENHAQISANAEAMYDAMTGQPGYQQMPLGLPSLPATQIAEFQAWISQGKLNN